MFKQDTCLSKDKQVFANLRVTTWVTLTPAVCPFSSSALSSEENKKSYFTMCFEKETDCFFLKYWKIKNSSIKKGGLISKECSPIDTIGGKLCSPRTSF